MNFEINISHQGKHLFATTERSLHNMEDTRKLYQLLKRKFRKEQGYEITVTMLQHIGQTISME